MIQDIDIFFILYISVKHKANIRRYLYIRIMNHYKLSKRECVCKYQVPVQQIINLISFRPLTNGQKDKEVTHKSFIRKNIE